MSNDLFMDRCTLCPRNCGADRSRGELGYCGLDDKIYISSICIHKGEEPPVSGDKGICNVFFAHCNMHCVYCQNYQISDNSIPEAKYEISLEHAVEKIIEILDTGIPALGFVSPTHQIPQMLSIIRELRFRKYKPVIVYNSNGYDKASVIRELEGFIDVYLPDFKYSDEDLGDRLSEAPDYPRFALKAIKEMYRQKGSYLAVNEAGYVQSGLIIRHLVLPGFVNNSLAVMNLIAKEISPKVSISLMSQYFPPKKLYPDCLNYKITGDEYRLVTEEMEKLGLYNGWVQEYESHNNYRPDFNKIHPFEGK